MKESAEKSMENKSIDITKVLSDAFPGQNILLVLEDKGVLGIGDFGFNDLVKRIGMLEGALLISKRQFTDGITLAPQTPPAPAPLAEVHSIDPAETGV